ncbi:hypothetical protein CN384_06265 [Bacillus thuringiensis]|nr:hypothetical protein CN384_06265 [Bacillus thuringiensis]
MGLKKIVCLYITGDYFANQKFEEQHNPEDFYKQMIKEGITSKNLNVKDDCDETEVCVELEIKEFINVDEVFLEFLKLNFIHNSADDRNLYIVKEEEM